MLFRSAGCSDAVKANRILSNLEEIAEEDYGSDAVVQQLEPWATGEWANVTGIALACKEWFAQYAPLVFSRVHVGGSQIEEFCKCVQHPDSPIRKYAKSVAVMGSCSWEMISMVSVTLPQASIIGCWTHSSDNRYTQYNMEPGSVVPGGGSTSSGLRVLSLDCCQFSSAVDFARLIRSFPSLSVLIVKAVTFDKSHTEEDNSNIPSNHHIVRGLRVAPTTIVVRQPKGDMTLNAFSLWDVSSAEPNGTHTTREGRFPGVPTAELRWMASNFPEYETVVVRLEPCSVRANTCKDIP